MKIEHIAIWTTRLEELKSFYERYFGARTNAKYRNAAKQYESYFLTFASGARLEIMQRPDILPLTRTATHQYMGYTHLAFAVGSEAAVDALTARLAADGYAHIDGPRRTGDGYYESVVLDPDGNRIEITV
ncbi:MAG: VOC family protein [Caldilineaceae bacterium]